MPSQFELDSMYMGAALLHARMSKAVRAKVGACLVTTQGVMLGGVNGQPAGLSNECEYLDEEENLVTKSSTIHAETNAILRAAKEGVSCLGATMYVTLSPCVPCSAMLVNAGIKELVYNQDYRDSGGIGLLREAGVKVRKF